MKNILSFLNKFQDLVRNKTFIEECCETVFKDLLLPITKKDLELVGSVLCIKSRSPALRSEVYLKKKEILQHIEGRVGKGVVSDIK